MNDLVKINYESDRPTVLGRDLHKALQVKTPYAKWFSRMKEYGFSENTDFLTLDKNVLRADGVVMPKTQIDHQITIQMAKELCMIQRSEIGKKCREYFIAVEEEWNSPEAVLSRALRIAEAKLDKITNKNKQLEDTVTSQKQQIEEFLPKVGYYDTVLNCKNLIAVSIIAKEYGWSAKRLNDYLHDKGVQFRQGKIWLLYQKYAEKGYTSTRTHTYIDDEGTHTKVHTYWTQKGRLFIYELLKQDGICPLVERRSTN